MMCIIWIVIILILIVWIFFLYRKCSDYKKKIICEREKKNYFELYFELLMQWKQLEQNGEKITQKLCQDGYRKVAVYGMKKIGWILCNDLLGAGIDVAYAIDRNADALAYNAYTDIPDVKLCLPNEELDAVDLIIVTAIQSYQDIKANLMARYPYKIVSLKELVDNM